MKTKVVISALLFVTLACGFFKGSPPTPTETAIVPSATNQQATASPTPPPATPTNVALPFPTVSAPEIISLKMVNTHDGWALTEQAVLRTNDGGLIWYEITPAGETNLGYGTGFSVLDEHTTWILAANPETPESAGMLYRTQDGGQNWDEITVPFSGSTIDFVDTNQGWIMLDLGAGAGSMGVSIYRTTDGGISWTQVYTNDPNFPAASDSLPLGGIKTNLVASDGQTAWVAGVVYAPGVIYLYKSQDGGETWALQELPIVPEIQNAEASTQGPILLSDSVLILPVQFFGETMQTGIYISQDSGESWEFLTILPGLGQVDFVSQSDGFYWSGEELYFSADGGQTWDPIVSNTEIRDHLVSMDFVDAQTGWVITVTEAGQNTLHQTTDGGTNWVQLSPINE